PLFLNSHSKVVQSVKRVIQSVKMAEKPPLLWKNTTLGGTKKIIVMKLRCHTRSSAFFRALTLVTFLLPGMSAIAQKLHVMSYNIHHGADRSEVLTLEEI